MIISFKDIEKEYETLVEKLDSFSGKFPYGTQPAGSGVYHVEIYEDGKLALVGTDRNIETVRKETHSLDEFMYWVFSDFAYSYGWEYEFQNRHSTTDSRRIAFPKALDFIERLSLKWRDRLISEQVEILKNSPYQDSN